jgi:hypothetical protein
MVKKLTLIVLLISAVLVTRAQVNCFVQTQLDRNTVYAQQPFKVTFTVLTATWYTAPLEFDNLQIPNAFIMPFDKTIPGMFPFNGKQYAGLQFYYIVFPYKAGRFTLPAINIVAETPAVGDYKGKKVNIKTRPIFYIVKPVPKGMATDNWFVAKDVSISKTWNKPLNKLKVGDVIISKTVINARGTLPQFIPELKTDSLDWAGVYPGSATLADTRDEYDANGARTQTATYLLEKEGDFTFPPSTIEWFNPNNGRVYKRNTPLVKIHVAPNPNLGILKTLKDSLNAKQPIKETLSVKHGPKLIYGIPWYYFALYSLAALCVLYFIVRIIVKVIKWGRGKYRAYLSSEEYWFGKFKSSSMTLPVLFKNLYAWWDRFPIANKSASLQNDTKIRNEDQINQEMATYYKQQYADGVNDAKADSDFKKNVNRYRNDLLEASQLQENDKVALNQTEWEK